MGTLLLGQTVHYHYALVKSSPWAPGLPYSRYIVEIVRSLLEATLTIGTMSLQIINSHSRCIRTIRPQAPRKLLLAQRSHPTRCCSLPSSAVSILDTVAAVQQSADSSDGVLSVAAWVVVGTATAASAIYMSRAFSEAKAAIERREKGERLKQQEEEAKKQKIKDMFERL